MCSFCLIYIVSISVIVAGLPPEGCNVFSCSLGVYFVRNGLQILTEFILKKTLVISVLCSCLLEIY